MVIAYTVVGIGLVFMGILFAQSYLRPDANVLTKYLHRHWKESPIRVPGTNKWITYDKYFLVGAVILLVVGLKLLGQVLFRLL
jgi:hypothetical protein